MNSRTALIAAVPVLALAAGIAIGIAYASPGETDIVPAPSFSDQGAQMLQYVCMHNKAFSALSKAERNEQKSLEHFNIHAAPLSDRGVICTVDGVMLTRRNATTVTSEPLQATILVATTGDAEVVTREFAEALWRSIAVKAMASNVGNDGTVVPKLKLSN